MRAPEHKAGNPAHAEPDWPHAVIASAFLTGLLIAKALERRGVKVLLVDCDPNVHGFRSSRCTTLKCPNPDTDPEAWLAFMQELAFAQGSRPVLMAASDQFVTAIGRFSDELGRLYRISSGATLQAELAVKEGQIGYARSHGLPIPFTVHASSLAEVTEFAENARFPVLIKPRQHRFWSAAPPGHPMHVVKAVRAETRRELLQKYAHAAKLSPEVILQELIDAPDTNKRVFVGVYRTDGEPVVHYTLKEIRCLELFVPTVCEPVDDPKVVEICDRFFRDIGYRGTCEIELIWDDRDGEPKMLDINPRFTGSGDALAYAGIDQGWLVYLDQIGQPVERVAPLRTGFRHVFLALDAQAICQQIARGRIDWTALRRSYRRPIHFWDADMRDWRLSASTLTAVFRTFASLLFRRISNEQHPRTMPISLEPAQSRLKYWPSRRWADVERDAQQLVA